MLYKKYYKALNISTSPMSLDPTKRRLIGDLRLLKQHPENYFDAVADEENMYIWYFLLANFKDCAYEGGYYLGKIILDNGYPFKAGNIQMMTPSGRFLVGKNICVTATAYHQSEYNVTWNIKSLIIGFHSIMMSDDKDNYGVSHIRLSETSIDARREMARNSVEYNKKHYLNIFKKFERFVDSNGNPLPQVIMPNTTPTSLTKPAVVSIPASEPAPIALPTPTAEPVPTAELELTLTPTAEPVPTTELAPTPEPIPTPELPAPKKRTRVTKKATEATEGTNTETKPKRGRKPADPSKPKRVAKAKTATINN